MRASGTAASARPGSSSSARAQRGLVAGGREQLGLARHERVEERAAPTGRGCAPTNSSTTAPSRKALTAGMPWMPKACARRGLASVSTFASTTVALARRRGLLEQRPSARQGPHQAAQKSTTTGVVRERSSTSRSKSASLTSITVMRASLRDRV